MGNKKWRRLATKAHLQLKVGKWKLKTREERRWLLMAIIGVQREATTTEKRMPREMAWEGINPSGI